ncbi:MAG: metallophosphoesterase family protein [Bacteroidales bacterium]
MVRIGLISDTHGIILPFVKQALQETDEIWHAGDIGGLKVLDELREIKPLRAVHGNIDDHLVRRECPEYLLFEIESLKVLMMHIGGYPGKYSPEARKLINLFHPGLFISGHSHILKVMPDLKNNLLHLNPGACGKQGIHTKMTLLRFVIEGGKVSQLEIVEKA